MTQRTKYLHLRRYAPAGFDMETGERKEETILAKGGKTIAYNVDENGNVTGCASANCHAKDVYSKKQGRVKATGRLASPRFYQEITIPMTEQEFVKAAHEAYYM